MDASRKEHLQWCKDRALEYLNPGPHFSIPNALASMGSDLNKHEETRDHPAITLGTMLLLGGHMQTVEAVRKWINGFN